MSIEIIDNDKEIVTLKVRGRLTQPDFLASQKAAAKVLRAKGISRLLLFAEDFQGWARDGDWGDLSGQIEMDSCVERIAIVGEERWKDLALLFSGKGIRRVSIEYFLPRELNQARAWLMEKNPQKQVVEL